MRIHKVEEGYQRTFDNLLLYSKEEDKLFDKGVEDEINSFSDSIVRKIANTRAYLINEQIMAMALKIEIERLKDMERESNKRIEWLKKYIKSICNDDRNNTNYRYNLK